MQEEKQSRSLGPSDVDKFTHRTMEKKPYSLLLKPIFMVLNLDYKE